MKMRHETHDEVGEAARDERADRDALERDDADHRADDERGDELGGRREQLQPAAAGDGREQSREHSEDADGRLKRVNHRLERDLSRGNRHEDRRCEQDDAPVESVAAERRERRVESEYLEAEHDARRVDHRHVVADEREQQHGAECDVFRSQRIAFPFVAGASSKEVSNESVVP